MNISYRIKVHLAYSVGLVVLLDSSDEVPVVTWDPCAVLAPIEHKQENYKIEKNEFS